MRPILVFFKSLARRCAALACATSLVGLTGVAGAQTSSLLSSPFGAAAPTKPINPTRYVIVQDASYTTTQISREATLTSAPRWGQSFTAQNTGFIANIRLQVRRYCSSSTLNASDVILTVRQGTSISGPVLLTSQIRADAISGFCGTINLTSNVLQQAKRISAGTVYTIFATVGQPNLGEIGWTGGEDGYAGGSIIDAVDGVGTPDTTGDFQFLVSTQIKQ